MWTPFFLLNSNNSTHVFENRFQTGIVGRTGKIKYILLDGPSSTARFVAGTRYTLGTLPSEYIPAIRVEKIVVIAASEDVTYTARLIMTTTGEVIFTPFVNRSEGDQLKIYEAYI